MTSKPLPTDFISTSQVAIALKVSVSTIKRWVEDGVLPARKTAGGHRKLLLADVLEFARREHLPAGELYKLAGNVAAKRPPQLAELVDRLYRGLIAGDDQTVRATLQGAYWSGVSIDSLADDLIAPAMEKIGAGWEHGRLDVLHEHRATQLLIAALIELKAVLDTKSDKQRPTAVGGAIEGDQSELPTLLAQMTLLDAGWRAVNLGPNTPLASLSLAVKELRPRLVWLSVSHVEDEKRFLADYRALFKSAARADVPVVVGGRALTESVRASIPYTAFGDGIRHLAAFAHTLHPRAHRPRRGRPAQSP